jgi:hypothetical protein
LAPPPFQPAAYRAASPIVRSPVAAIQIGTAGESMRSQASSTR